MAEPAGSLTMSLESKNEMMDSTVQMNERTFALKTPSAWEL